MSKNGLLGKQKKRRYDSGMWPSKPQPYLTKFYYLALAMD